MTRRVQSFLFMRLPRSRDTPYFLNKLWFGNDVTYEAAIAFYQLVIISVSHQEDLNFCLKTDVFHTGVVPRQHVKSLDITLTSEACHESEFDYRFGPENEQQIRHLINTVRWLDSLLGLPNPANLRIQVFVKVASKRTAAQLEEQPTPLVMKMWGRGNEILVMHDLDPE
ncbi:uncharacterized protein M421DRAFT_334499 [Didymella exigua CBS 183.55]|uniref:Uncharacterized protein n=1 Tax=Didymella exigua CBS 183.55 TaxID=1150837 RepID=A0A6A5R4L0_9PLEO|nr:uncharacterized protein M421DRAFT_334499 [Didymella exigua CBS 183.55]KAF1923031.1 hypothetical protein M421DRAFT_334499 [Didymella exigua CBS 183.55]